MDQNVASHGSGIGLKRAQGTECQKENLRTNRNWVKPLACPVTEFAVFSVLKFIRNVECIKILGYLFEDQKCNMQCTNWQRETEVMKPNQLQLKQERVWDRKGRKWLVN